MANYIKMIVLITPTGGRERQIQLCAKWMKAQTCTEEVLWIIVDDCFPRTTDFIPFNFRENWTVVKIYPKPIWEIGQNTQSRNLHKGMEVVPDKIEVSSIFIIEDDDYYKPKYLEIMTSLLEDYDLCGEANTFYFNTKINAGHRCRNKEHSSLFQTAFKPTIIPEFKRILAKNKKFIDIELFKLKVRKNLFTGLDLAVGIKGLPGRDGIGVGHRLKIYSMPDLTKIEELIGKDALEYIN